MNLTEQEIVQLNRVLNFMLQENGFIVSKEDKASFRDIKEKLKLTGYIDESIK